MAERQYIGARYVPIFYNNPNTGDSTWLTGVAYEALTIVTFANNTYTSKKPVPAGIGSPNLHPEYWVATANYNAQIEEIATELRGEMEQLEQDTDTKLNTKEEVFSKRRYLFVGDSYAQVSPSWIATVVGKLGIPAENYHDLSVSGTGFTIGLNNNGFLAQLQTAVESGYDAEEITDIVVVGGLNDSTYDNTGSALSAIKPAISAFCTYANTHFPKAKIWIAYAGFASDTSEVLMGRNILKRHIAQWAYSQGAQTCKTGININLDAWKTLAMNYQHLGSDLLHPSSYGSAELGNQIANWLSGGSFNVWRPEDNGSSFSIVIDKNGANIGVLPATFVAAIPANPTGYEYENVLPFYVNKTFVAFGYLQQYNNGTYTLYSIKYVVVGRSVRIIPNVIANSAWAALPEGQNTIIDCKFTIPWEYIG